MEGSPRLFAIVKAPLRRFRFGKIEPVVFRRWTRRLSLTLPGGNRPDLSRADGPRPETEPNEDQRTAWRSILAAHDKRGSPLALAAADEALSVFPDDLEFLAARGRQLTLLRRFADAEACLLKAISLDPKHETAMLHLAQLFIRLGRYVEAEDVIAAALTLDPKQELTLIRAGLLLHSIGLHLEAARCLTQAMGRSPDPSLLAHHKAILAALGEDAEAGANPAVKPPLINAMDMLRRSDPIAAELAFARITKDHPQAAAGWIGLRGALEVQGRVTEANALSEAWKASSPSSAKVIEIGCCRKLGSRGLLFDPRDRFSIQDMARSLRCAKTGAELVRGADAYLVLDQGGAEVARDPVVSLDGTGANAFTVSYRTAPKYLCGLRNAALVGEGLVFREDGALISEFIPPSKPSKYGGTREMDSMTFDPFQFRDGMGRVRFYEQPALVMCGPTDASFGDWIINFPPRLAYVEAAGLQDLAIVLRRPPQSQALDMLRALGIGPERIIYHDLDTVSLFSRLIVPSWPTPAKLAPTAGVYDVYRRLRPDQPRRDRPLLYLTRKNVSSRPMLNEDEVCDLFVRHGFQIVDPGSLSFSEMRDLFASPACVAGPFGSAFHNLAFSSGSPVSLVLLPDHTKHHLAEVALWHSDLGLRFGYLWGSSTGNDASNRHAPWMAPLDRLDRAIDIILEIARQVS